MVGWAQNWPWCWGKPEDDACSARFRSEMLRGRAAERLREAHNAVSMHLMTAQATAHSSTLHEQISGERKVFQTDDKHKPLHTRQCIQAWSSTKAALQ